MDFLKELYFFDKGIQFDRVGDSIWILLMLIGFFYIYQQKNELLNKAVVYPGIFYTVFILNPLSSYILSEKMGFSTRMYRFMWMFPALLVLGYVGIDLLGKLTAPKRYFLILFMVVVSFFTGGIKKDVYTTENIYKVQDELLVVTELLHKDEDQIFVFFEDDNMHLTSVQYDPKLSVNITEREQIFDRIEEAKKEKYNLDTLEFYNFVNDIGIEYFVLLKDTDVFQSEQYIEFISETEKSRIYKLKDIKQSV